MPNNKANKAAKLLQKTNSKQFGRIFDYILKEISVQYFRLDLYNHSDVEEYMIIFDDKSCLYYCEGTAKFMGYIYSFENN